MFVYACNAKPATMEGAAPDHFSEYDPEDIRGVYGVVGYAEPLPKSDEDLLGLRLVDGPFGKYRVTAIKRQTGIRVACNTYIGVGYDVLRRADFEAIRHEQNVKEMALEWLGYS